ncbi:MAG: DUF262 domain-containing protein [Selenomonadaceae bacterium]|nr:DUF262 domain-containing protein [Selenomonadaceae bacterium]
MANANSLESLDEIFNKRLFRIPDYQRGYSWEKDQLEDFWDDLERLEDGKDHYTGLLTLKKLSDKQKTAEVLTADDMWKTEKGSNFEVCYVVDGQQRLTTAIILIQCLVKYFEVKQEYVLNQRVEDIVKKYLYDTKPNANNIAYIFGCEDTTDPSYDYLRFKIFKCAGKPSHNQNSETYYTNNLKEAVKFFTDKIAEIKSASELEDIYEKLTAHMKFNLYEIDNELDEYVSFETMNNRGKKLSNLELLKNRLIYLTTLFDDTYADDERNNLRKEINRAWKEIYFWLGKETDSHHLSDDDFLRQHWIIYFKIPAKKADELMDFLMNKTFSAKKLKKNKHAVAKDKTTYENIRNYVTSLHDFVKFYYYTFYPLDSSLPDTDKRLLDSLTPSSGRLNLGAFRPLLMTVLHKEDAVDSSERTDFFKALERLIFIHSLQKSTRSDFGSFTYEHAQNFYKGKMSLKAVTDDLKCRADEDVSKSVKDFIERLAESFDKKEKEKGYYKFKEILRHVLYEYECKLAAEEGINKITDVKELFSNDRGAKISIEHIFPQTSKPYWDKIFDGVDDDQKCFLQNSLGNLLLLSQKINSSLQNSAYPEKKARYKKNSHSAIEVSNNSQWTAAEIIARSEKLVDFMNIRWFLNLNDTQKKFLIHFS